MQPKKWCLANAFAAYYKFNAYQLHPPPYPYNIFLPVLGFNNVDVVVRARTSILQHYLSIGKTRRYVCMSYAHPTKLKTWDGQFISSFEQDYCLPFYRKELREANNNHVKTIDCGELFIGI